MNFGSMEWSDTNALKSSRVAQYLGHHCIPSMVSYGIIRCYATPWKCQNGVKIETFSAVSAGEVSCRQDIIARAGIQGTAVYWKPGPSIPTLQSANSTPTLRQYNAITSFGDCSQCLCPKNGIASFMCFHDAFDMFCCMGFVIRHWRARIPRGGLQGLGACGWRLRCDDVRLLAPRFAGSQCTHWLGDIVRGGSCPGW